ncbi:MAG: hypothetical protein ACP5XB_22800 [Isosphaeraceae bacterium]
MRRLQFVRLPGALLLALMPVLSSGEAWAGGVPNTHLGQADFRYAPPWWQSAICLPDDPDKILVGKEGQLLLDFGHGVVRNFGIVLQPELDPGAAWVKQQTISPRAPVVQTFKNTRGVDVLEEAFVVVPGRNEPGPATRPHLTRRIVVLCSLHNGSRTEARRQLVLRIFTREKLATDKNHEAMVGASTRIQASLAGASLASIGESQWAVRLPLLTIGPGESRQVVWTIDRNDPERHDTLSPEQALAARDAARNWWEQADLPFATIHVPDPDIQGMLDACIRNIWQAREIKQGLPAFHVGPTVYRGLWVVDGSFLLEAAAILGRAHDARAGVEYLLSHQKPDGSFEIIPCFWKENGIVLWAATRHAFLTQDQSWLRSRWPRLRAVVKAIQTLRSRASTDPKALELGLLPPGEVDGGISNRTKPEYSNTYWCLAGLKAAIAAANWLGETADATAWQREYDNFLSIYRNAAARDTLRDASGNAYVPTMMGNIDHHVPQRGQWAFCHAVYPGGVFKPGDPLVVGQLAMLRATKSAGEGLVYDTGWMHQGIWTYFASFYGHAVLWNGQGREAAEVLYDFARHASPSRTWREEQKPVGKGNEEVGDMPHNWASAEFIRLCTHLIELDRGSELHLLEGFPREWAGPGMVTRLDGVLTPFGPLHLELRVAADGKSARLKIGKLTGSRPARIVLHLAGLAGRDRTIDLPTDRDIDETIDR